GHPYFDELRQQRLDATFIAAQRSHPGEIVGLLPGSRTQEIERNLSTLVNAAVRIHDVRPETRFLFACFKASHLRRVATYLRGRGLTWIQPFVGRTAEIITLAHSCIAVSGSVGLELLYHGKPSVVLYRIRPIDLMVCRWFKTSRYISLVNLLADKELFPEFLTDRCEAEAISGHVLGWLREPASYEALCAELEVLRQSIAKSGACERAAHFILQALNRCGPGMEKAA